jgi:hypothetical protein
MKVLGRVQLYLTKAMAFISCQKSARDKVLSNAEFQYHIDIEIVV